MFTVYSCGQPFRLFQSVPPNITSFWYEVESKWTVRKTAKNHPQAIATPSICPSSVLHVADGIQISTVAEIVRSFCHGRWNAGGPLNS